MDWFRERRDLLVLDRIRNAFRNQYFGDIEIWRLFGANVTLNVWESYKENRNSHKNYFYFFYYFFLKDALQYVKHQKKLVCNTNISKPFVVEAITEERRIKGFWLPVAEEIPKEKVLLLTENTNVYLNNKSKFNIHFLIEFSLAEWIKSRLFIINFILKNFKVLYKKKSLFAPLKPIHIINILILQISYVVKIKYLIKKHNPNGFLTFWDWYELGSAGSCVFKSSGLPSFTFIHGAAGEKSLREFVPLNADYIFSWGKYNTRSLINLGVTQTQILECGCQRMASFNDKKFNEIASIKNTILILLTAIIDEYFTNDIVYVVNHYSKDYSIIVRLHPSTMINNLDIKLQNLNINFVTCNDETIEMSIGKSEFIIVDTSTAGFDAINMDKPVFVIDSAPVQRAQDIMEDIVNYSAAIFCRSVIDFDNNFQHYIVDEEYRRQLSLNRKRFVDDFILDTGAKATNNIIKYLNSIVVLNLNK